MEKEIIDILQANLDYDNLDFNMQQAAKEITEHVMEFIEWLRLNCDTGNGYWDIGDLTDYYDADIYQYWLTNIKDK